MSYLTRADFATQERIAHLLDHSTETIRLDRPFGEGLPEGFYLHGFFRTRTHAVREGVGRREFDFGWAG